MTYPLSDVIFKKSFHISNIECKQPNSGLISNLKHHSGKRKNTTLANMMEMFWRLSLGAWGGARKGLFLSPDFLLAPPGAQLQSTFITRAGLKQRFWKLRRKVESRQVKQDGTAVNSSGEEFFMYCERLCAATTPDRLIDQGSSAYLSRQDARIRTKVWPEASSFCMDTEGAAVKYSSVVALFFTYFYHIACGCRFVCPWSCFSRIWKSGSLSRPEKPHDAIPDRSFSVLCIML